jgi:hypothetical protein
MAGYANRVKGESTCTPPRRRVMFSGPCPVRRMQRSSSKLQSTRQWSLSKTVRRVVLNRTESMPLFGVLRERASHADHSALDCGHSRALARLPNGLVTLPVRERVEIQLDHPELTLVQEERAVLWRPG